MMLNTNIMTMNRKSTRRASHSNNRSKTKHFSYQARPALYSAAPATPPITIPRAFDAIAYAAALEVLG